MPSVRRNPPIMITPDKKPKLDGLVKSEISAGQGQRRRGEGHSALANPQPPPQLPSVQMFDTEVLYRRCGNLILFKTNSVLKLVEKWMNLSYAIPPIINNPELNKRCEALKSPLISWGSLKLLLNGIIEDLALGDLLSLYSPFLEDLAGRKDEKGFGLLNAVSQVGAVGTRFSVNLGKVYLSIDGVRSLCMERDETLHQFKEILENKNIQPQDAYFRDVDGRLDKEKILLELIFPALCEESKVEAILRHLERKVEEVKERKSSLVEEIEQTVNMINRQTLNQQACAEALNEYAIKDVKTNLTNSPSKDKHKEGQVPGVQQGDNVNNNGIRRTYKECTNSQCGRTYHFIVSCCSLEHVMELDKIKIPYMFHKGKIFLEKCSAFEAIGKTSVIRCSNYRKVDKILAEYNLNPSAEFLQQEKFTTKRPRRRKLRHPENSKIGRNRRNHVSLAALSVLIEANFVSTNKQSELLKSLHKFTNSLESSGPGPRCSFNPEDQHKQDHIMDEVIELSEDEMEVNIKNEIKCKLDGVSKLMNHEEDAKSSSGVESEDECILPDTPPQSNSPSPEPEAVPQKIRERKPSARNLTILDSEMQYKVLGDVLYLKKTAVFKLFHMKGVPRKMSECLEKMIQDSGFSLEKAFLYEGRLANYVSTLAIRHVLLNSDAIVPEVCKDIFITELNRVESDLENLATIKYLQLKTLGSIKYQIQDDVVYFDTLRVMSLAGMQPTIIKNSPSKANAFVKKLLQDRGVNINACFLRQRQSKYAFINLRSALILLQYASENENKEKASKLKKEMLNAANNKNILKHRNGAENQPQEKLARNYLKISADLPDLKYKIKGGMIYVHRKTVYETIGLESVILGTKKGFLPVNSIITDLGFDFSQVYLSNQQEVFAYMWLPAILLLLEAMDPIMVMLPKRMDFLVQLCLAIESSVAGALGSSGSMLVDKQKIPWITKNGRLYFERETLFGLSKLRHLSEWVEVLNEASTLTSNGDQQAALKIEELVIGKGLELDKDFACMYGDPVAYIGLHATLCIFAQEGDYTRGRDAHALSLRDTLSAISSFEPKLRNHIRMSHFRMCFVNRILCEFLRSLQEQGAGLELDTDQGESGLELDNHSEDELASPGPGGRQQQDEDALETVTDVMMREDGEEEEMIGEKTVLQKIRADLISLTGGNIGGTIGDWELVCIEPVTHLSVRAGYGAARKLSFMQADVAAILKYDLYISRDSCELCINEHKIVGKTVNDIVGRTSQDGGLSLLYQLISLRPCFGSFGPEIVETVGQALEHAGDKDNYQFTVDTNFIGTSSQGRTYAGTVRSLDCAYLAQSRVADRCSACTKLDSLVINRSLLSGEAGLHLANSDSESDVGKVKTSKPSHQSVWKLDTTDEKGCSFLCPQVQTFNCSLPHAFVGSAQATTVVHHRVEISDTLQVKLELCGKLVTREFPGFGVDHQLGPLLDRVAGLRLCVGYPAHRLVKQARYIMNHVGRMIPEMRKLFKHYTVDEDFLYRIGGEEEIGTMRSAKCNIESEVGSDICPACRTLQQPIEFQ